jgi:hypothetical protein
MRGASTIVIRPSRPRYSLDELVRRITPKNRRDESERGPSDGCAGGARLAGASRVPVGPLSRRRFAPEN